MRMLYVYLKHFHSDNLTINKIYDVADTTDNYYCIKDDNNIFCYINKKCFITIKQLRKLKLDKIYENNRRISN